MELINYLFDFAHLSNLEALYFLKLFQQMESQVPVFYPDVYPDEGGQT